LDELARELLIEEHSVLRAEILASYGYAQSIVKWTLATFAALTAAGLVAINNATGVQDNPILINVIPVVFGFGIPGIIWLNATTWLGELYRAERAGSYLRALETNLSKIPGLRERIGFEPSRWERFIWSNRDVKSLWGKQIVTYLGTAGTFFGPAVGSFVVLWIVAARLNDQKVLEPADTWWLWLAGSGLVHVVCICLCMFFFARLMRIGKAVAPLLASY